MDNKKRIKYFILKSAYYLMSLLPTKGNRLFFSCFGGTRYADSPRYISEFIHEHYSKTEIIWNRNSDYTLPFPDYVKSVNEYSLRYFYYMATAKVWVDSNLKRSWIRKKKDQFFVETWHGGLGFKKIESDISSQSSEIVEEQKNAIHTAQIADVFLSNSKWITDIYRKAFKYNGTILEAGMPKNDIFFEDHSEIAERVKRKLGISADRAIILYSPTFRDYPQKEAFNIDFKGVIEAFSTRFNRDCVVLVRFHPRMIKESDVFYEYSEKIINATHYSDAQEIMLAADYMITDYSSIIFDFMLMKKPGFLLMLDFENYQKERGFYVDHDYFPFPYAKSNETLIKKIHKFNVSEYMERIEQFSEEVQLCDNGSATEQICHIIMNEIEKENV